MLNISLKRINQNIDLDKYESFRITKRRSVSQVLLRLMIIVLIGTFLAMFLPWTQNIRAKGSVTTMSPDDRPQSVQATIGGKIEKWYVNEGAVVSKGDTAKTKADIAANQLARIQNLYDEGLKSLTDLEAKRLSIQEAQAKVVSLENKVNSNKNELTNLKANIAAITNEYDNKIAKSKADRMSALSAKYDADASQNKLQSQYNTYEVRQANYYITSPIDGTVTQAITTGIGELIKAGDDIVNIIPKEYKLAVETFIRPMDMPLLDLGQKVRVQFDGWPAIVFSGWPNSSYGTFGGEIFAINNDINENGKYRILIAPDSEDAPWPNEVRVGGGANTLTLLNNVKVGYELWRQLNGFPADYYKDAKSKNVKTKAPLKKVK